MDSYHLWIQNTGYVETIRCYTHGFDSLVTRFFSITNQVIFFQLKSWGLDFHRNGEVLKTEYGRYSTEIFNDEAIKIIDEHDTEKVNIVMSVWNLKIKKNIL